MSNILTHGEKQLVLYTKGHFEQSNMIDDLRSITAENFEIPVDSTEFYHIYDWVTKIFLKLKEASYITISTHDFLCSLFTWETPVLKPEDMLRKMLSHIRGVVVAGIDLGVADERYLNIKQPLEK